MSSLPRSKKNIIQSISPVTSLYKVMQLLHSDTKLSNKLYLLRNDEINQVNIN